MEWYSNWRDCVQLCHPELPLATRQNLLNRLSALEAESTHIRPILAAKSNHGSAAYLVLHPGSLAAIGGLHMDDPRASANRVDASILLEDLIDCAALEVEMIQAVVTHGELPIDVEKSHEAVFRAAGLKLEAVLCQLEKQLVSTKEPSMFEGDQLLQLGPDLTMIDANTIEEDRLEAIVEATYIDTLDVPELNGIRSTHNTITGYAACVHTPPMPWWVIRWKEYDIGCLFLCQHGMDFMELVYIGLIPEGRGKRLSYDVMEFVHKWSISRGASRIVAAVDSRNEPALKLYRHFGYEQVGLAHAWFLAT